MKKLTRQDFERFAPSQQPKSVLRWRRVSEASFDLQLENPSDIDREEIEGLYDAFMKSEGAAQQGFNKYLRHELADWIHDPVEPLPSVAYGSLSNWFLTGFGALRSSPRGAAAGRLWDRPFLYAPKPDERLTPTESGQNHIVLKEPFERWWKRQLELQGPVPPPPELGRFEQLCAETFLPVSLFEDCEKLLETKRQFILQGAPGTGKTYVAERLGAWWAGGSDRVLPVQFHESYGYEDFVYGIRPVYDRERNSTSFMPVNGVFLELCEKARKDRASRYVLIIDEIKC